MSVDFAGQTERLMATWPASTLGPGVAVVKLSDNAVRDVVERRRRVRSAASPFVKLEATPSETSLKGIHCLAGRAAGKGRRATLDVTGNVDIG